LFCEPILRALPQWFGIKAALAQYIQEMDTLPTLLAERNGRHTACAAEIYVMGVRPEARRQGLGHALVQRAEAYLRLEQVGYLQVKAFGGSNPDDAQMRAF
jgi:GNAT superfamily N-acetyltransferase